MIFLLCLLSSQRVALRKESVDRNVRLNVLTMLMSESLSARRAWIEIIKFVNIRLLDGSLSARRAWIEIHNGETLNALACLSLSARRAWIEMRKYHTVDRERASLSARRAWIEILFFFYNFARYVCRSPQGERG